MATGTDPAHVQTVPRETSALLQVSPEKVSTAQAAVEEVARATVLSWAPNTTKSYLAGWNDFTSWCIEHNCPGLPAAPDVVGRYLEDLVETQGKALTTARNRLAAIAAAHRLGKHPDPVNAPLVKATQAGQWSNQRGPRCSKGDGPDPAGPPGQAPAQGDRIPGCDAGRGGPGALEVMRDGLLRGSEASALRWGDLEFQADGSGRLHVLRSKTDQTAEGVVLYPGSAAVDALLAIRPNEAVINPGASVFGLSARQISRRIKAATKMAGLGEGFSGHSPRVGMAQDLSAAGAELPELNDRRAAGIAPPCRPNTLRLRRLAGAQWPGITGATCGSESQTL